MRSMTLLTALALAACAPADPLAPLDFGEPAEAMPVEQAAAPTGPILRTMVTTAPATSLLGDAVTITVTGATPGQRVRLYASTTGPGVSSFCPRELSFNCLDLVAPVRVATRTADASGTATFQGVITDPSFVGTVWLQASGVRLLSAGILPNLSQVASLDVTTAPGDTGDTDTDPPDPGCVTDLDWWPGADLDGDGTVDLGYRVLVDVIGGSQPLAGAPVTLTVDFGDLLDSLGQTRAFDPGSMRVVRQDCAGGLPEVPSQFADGLVSLDRKTDHLSAIGDERGTVVFLADDDGDLSTPEVLAPGARKTYGIYFAAVRASGPRPLPSYTTDLEVVPGNVWALRTAQTEVTFEQATGGLMRTLSHLGSPSLTSQTSSCCGNSMHFWSTTTQTGAPFGWITPQGGLGSIGLVEVGPLLTAVRASGTRSAITDAGVSYGTYTYDDLYWMFATRPEVWHTVRHTAITDCTTEHDIDATFGFRPFQVRHSSYLMNGATYVADQAARIGAVDGVAEGFSVGVHQPPAFFSRVANPLGALIGDPNPRLDYLSLHGNELVDTSQTTPFTVPAGVSYFDNIGMVMLPFVGAFDDARPTLEALMEGVEVSPPIVQTAP